MIKFHCRALVLAAVLAFAAPAAFAASAPYEAYDRQHFSETVQKGAPVIAHVHADWCGICRAQSETLAGLANTFRDMNVTLFLVDWDTEKDFVRENKVPSQSTLILYRDGEEVARSIGESDPAAIERFIVTGFQQ